MRYIENLAGPNNSANEDIEKIKDMLINMLRHGYYEQIFGPHRIVPRTNSFPPTSSNGYYIPSNLSGIARVTAILYLRHRDDGLFNNFSNEFSELLSRPEGLIGLEVRGIISDALNNNQKKSSAQPIQQEIVRLESKAKNQKRSHKDFPNLPLAVQQVCLSI